MLKIAQLWASIKQTAKFSMSQHHKQHKYHQRNHKLLVNERSDFNKIFQIDNIEYSFLERAVTEMESDGFISCRHYEWSLLEKGIYEARKMVV